MDRAEQEQRVLCEALQNLKYDVAMLWCTPEGKRYQTKPPGLARGRYACVWMFMGAYRVWPGPGRSARCLPPGQTVLTSGDPMSTPEEVIEWIRGHVAPTLKDEA